MLKMKFNPSKMQDDERCYITGAENCDLVRHHCLNGTHQRKKAEQDGLWVWLTPRIHIYIHETIEGHDLLWELKKDAQRVYEREHTREEFIERYGKSYL